MNEIVRAQEWLRATLNTAPAVSGGRIFPDVAPQGAEPPYTVFQYQGGGDLMESGAARVWSSLLFLVRVIDKTNTIGAALRTAADEIDARLHDKSGTTADGRVVSCVRTEPFQLAEVDQGVQYRHLGGIYRLYVQSL